MAVIVNPDYPITSVARREPGGRVVEIELPHAILTTQTCDLQNQHRIRIRPFVSVARVFDARAEFDAGTLGNIRRGRIGDLIPLSGPTFTQDPGAVWVADLRVEGAVERGVLVEKEVIEGFSSDHEYLTFQRALTSIRNRSAIDDSVLEHVCRPLRTFIGTLPQERLDMIVEIRIRAMPSLLAASAVDLFVLLDDGANQVSFRNDFDNWMSVVRRSLPDHLRLIDVAVTFATAFTRGDEIGTERLDFDTLSETA